MILSFFSLLLVASASILATLLLFRRKSSHKLPLPPSPKSDPIIGHARKIPSVDEHLVYAKLSKELNSDIISFTSLGQVFIILNSAKAANELLDRRSAKYSDRPELPIFLYSSLTDWTKNTGFVRYGERWRSQRRMSHAVLHKNASTQFWPLITRHSRLTMQRLIANPDNFVKEFRRMSGSTVLSAVYGYEVSSADDPLVKIVETAMAHVSEASVPGNFYVNTIPWLRFFPSWFPGTEWKQKTKEWSTELHDMVNAPFDWTKEQIAKGVARPSTVKSLLYELENSPNTPDDLAEDIDRIKWATAASDTSAATAVVFILAMTLYPEIQAKAQAEIDQVVGGNRLPEMEDRASLPYLECVLKEVLRWQTVVPLGVPHTGIEDGEYAGYRIPKGAAVFSNIWAMSNDSSIYPNPEIFNPDRFLDPSVPYPRTFGFGRRSCPGIHMAESALFMNMTSLLAIFNISPIRDDQGHDIPPRVEMRTNVLVSHPAEFKCSIKPRSQQAVKVLDSSV
ncbi:cytochrome P450 family protein [Ceratobasidium sp. AG-Ba]|nr:cytochrome P450 family protein [Ceratobasidium sp. AG-Ba]